jgi:hypothetical protein
MKGISKVSVKGFFIILTEEKYHENNRVTNVWFNDFTKEMLKLKKAYATAVENEENLFSRKIVFPLLSLEEIKQLFYECNFISHWDTAGSLSTEYGLLNARCYESYDNYSIYAQRSNAYVSVIFDFEGFDDIEKESTCMQKNYMWQERIEDQIWDGLDREDWEYLEAIMKDKFIFDNNQLEIPFKKDYEN